MKNNKEATLKEWGELLDKMGLNDVSTTKINIAQMMESEASKLLKEEMEKNNIISDWIDKYGDPKIDKKVGMKLEEINKERYNQIIDEVFKSWIESKKCYRIVMNIYVEPKFKILSVDEVTFDDFPYVNSDGFYGFEKDGVEEFWFDFSKFKGDYPKLIKILKSGFITKIKTDNEFSEKWGLKIEERELSLEERKSIAKEILPILKTFLGNQSEEGWIEQCEKLNVPTKLITLEYNQEKIYIYE